MTRPLALLLGMLALTVVAAAEPTLSDLVRAGDRAAVSARLARSPGAARESDADGTTPLHWAVRSDDEVMARALLVAGADPGASNRNGVTPLVLAATNRNANMTRALLDAGASPQAAAGGPAGGPTVLMLAARAGEPRVVSLLAKAGADVNLAEPALGETALMWAAAEDHAGAVTALAEAGAAVNARSRAMDFSRAKFGDGRSARFTVLPRGAWTALMFAARQNAPAAARALVAAGADINARDPDGTTALTLAVINAHYEMAALLLDLGADPNVADNTGMTPLYAAVDMNTLDETPGRPAPVPSGDMTAIEIIPRLLAKGANPDARLASPLLERVHNNPDSTLGAGATPLMRAARKGDLSMMRLLLEHGADASARTARGGTPLLYLAGLGGLGRFGEYDLTRATDAEFVDGMRLVLAHGASVNERDDTGQQALHVAAVQRDEATVRFLIESGAALDAVDAQGRTALDLADGGGRVRGGTPPEIRARVTALLRRAVATRAAVPVTN